MLVMERLEERADESWERMQQQGLEMEERTWRREVEDERP